MPFTPFTQSEVRLIFQLAERAGGHAGAAHVSITNSKLAGRIGGVRDGGVAARTAFLTFDDQVNAALELLNASSSDARVEEFRINARVSDGGHFTIEHELRTPLRMRYAIGDSAQTFPCRRVRLVLHKRSGPPRDMHVVTFFGEMG